MKNKKSLSQIITTILLILIGITAVLFIASIVIPFVKDSLRGGKECFETLEQLTINTDSGYTCYYGASGNYIVNITIKRGTKNIDIKNFKISVSGEGKNNVFDIQNGTNVKMLDSSTVEFPELGEERTYSLTTDLGEVLYAEVYPIVASGKICEATDRADLEKCV